MKAPLKILFLLILVLILIVIVAAIFIGTGYLFSMIFPLTLFESAILCISATFVSTFIFFGFSIGLHINSGYDENEYEEEDVEEDKEDTVRRNFTLINTEKIKRNAPCPCGSGKKYKHCCGKR